MTTPVKYLDLTQTPTEVLDVMTPTYQPTDLAPTHQVTHVDARQIHITVHQHITVAAPTAASVDTPQLEAPAPEPKPTYFAPLPTKRPGLSMGDVTALLALGAGVAVLVIVMLFIEAIVWAVSTALTVLAVVAVVVFLLSLGGGKCAGVIVHCGGCKG